MPHTRGGPGPSPHNYARAHALGHLWSELCVGFEPSSRAHTHTHTHTLHTLRHTLSHLLELQVHCSSTTDAPPCTDTFDMPHLLMPQDLTTTRLPVPNTCSPQHSTLRAEGHVHAWKPALECRYCCAPAQIKAVAAHPHTPCTLPLHAHVYAAASPTTFIYIHMNIVQSSRCARTPTLHTTPTWTLCSPAGVQWHPRSRPRRSQCHRSFHPECTGGR